ncbi:ATP-dependent nuclease [Corynebacterium glutamicum]|uniref:ATP-dependent nuclease n=1 Tax=Corynebacterium glutamicum TaxID=1718 RepID=UPI0009431553|nr:AAA family ATPase [Corynebacterium glutamicum]OKX81675.1 hypothetical protein AUO95_07785 [Corynebacterium glutamicum]
MKLSEIQIWRYRSIDDSTKFGVEPDVTCLVGKNESGKTATLQALYKSLPADSGDSFDSTMDYPTHRTREINTAVESPKVTSLTYELDDVDVEAVEEILGPNTLNQSTVTFTTKYDHSKVVSVSIDELAVVKHFLDQIELPPTVADSARAVQTPKELATLLKGMEGTNPTAERIIANIDGWRDSEPTLKAIDILGIRRPRFVYFGDYDIMPGKVSIPDLIERRETDSLSRGEKALLALLSIAGVKPEDLSAATDPNEAEYQIRKLENASNTISDEVFNYWSQNTELSVKLALIPGPGTAPSRPTKDQGPFLQVRVHNDRHRVTVPFDERSRGFVWFFSFLAYFSQIENESNYPLILLLDEPGLSLHATAQHDLLRFIRERLSPQHQVIFTTHSPFMVDAHKFGQVRTVVDSRETGTIISADVLKADAESAFPLHAAMGVELTQTLFVGPHVLFVEGPSDLVYLNYLSDAVQSDGGVGLDPRWTVVPGGGLSKLPVFLSLFGANDIKVAVLTDSSEKNGSEMVKLRQTGKVFDGGLIGIGEILDSKEADTEDLFSPSFYLALVNQAYAGALKNRKLLVRELPQSERLVKRVTELFRSEGINNGKLNHYAPAGVLLRPGARLPKIDAKTLQRSNSLFSRINALLPEK